MPESIALLHGKVYASPGAPPIENAVVLLADGKIEAVGSWGTAPCRAGQLGNPARLQGKVIVAGFWNSHVHFETGWRDAGATAADKLTAHMQEMLTRWGLHHGLGSGLGSVQYL